MCEALRVVGARERARRRWLYFSALKTYQADLVTFGGLLFFPFGVDETTTDREARLGVSGIREQAAFFGFDMDFGMDFRMADGLAAGEKKRGDEDDGDDGDDGDG